MLISILNRHKSKSKAAGSSAYQTVADTSSTEVNSYVEGGTRAAGVIGCSGTAEGEYYTVKVAGPASCGVSGATVFGDAYAVDSPNHVAIAPLDNGGSVPLEFSCDSKVITGFKDIEEVLYTSSGNTYTFTPDQSMDVIPLFEGDMNDVDTYEKLREIYLKHSTVVHQVYGI